MATAYRRFRRRRIIRRFKGVSGVGGLEALQVSEGLKGLRWLLDIPGSQGGLIRHFKAFQSVPRSKGRGVCGVQGVSGPFRGFHSGFRGLNWLSGQLHLGLRSTSKTFQGNSERFRRFKRVFKRQH